MHLTLIVFLMQIEYMSKHVIGAIGKLGEWQRIDKPLA